MPFHITKQNFGTSHPGVYKHPGCFKSDLFKILIWYLKIGGYILQINKEINYQKKKKRKHYAKCLSTREKLEEMYA